MAVRAWLVAVVVCGVLTATGPLARAGSPPATLFAAAEAVAATPPPSRYDNVFGPDWQYRVIKTITFRAVSSFDALAASLAYSGSLIGGGGLALINMLFAGGIYFGHDLVWAQYARFADSTTEFAAWKTVSYQLLVFAAIFATGYRVTQNITLAQWLAISNAVVGSLIYFGHEMVWLTWGPIDDGAKVRAAGR